MKNWLKKRIIDNWRSTIGIIAEHPPAILRGLNRVYHTRGFRRTGYPEGSSIFEFEWENLLLLDACRYDYFESEYKRRGLEGELQCRIAPVSSTPEFLKYNFEQKEYFDTVYVTSNPQFYKRREDLGRTFHARIEVWNTDAWDEELQTVPPNKMAKATQEAAKEYPNKRILAHFVQPHFPFIGDIGQEDLSVDANDRFGTVQYMREAPPMKKYSLYGTRKRVDVDLFNYVDVGNATREPSKASIVTDNLSAACQLLFGTARNLFEYARYAATGEGDLVAPGHYTLIDRFRESVEIDSEVPVTPADGRKVVRVLEEIEESSSR